MSDEFVLQLHFLQSILDLAREQDNLPLTELAIEEVRRILKLMEAVE